MEPARVGIASPQGELPRQLLTPDRCPLGLTTLAERSTNMDRE